MRPKAAPLSVPELDLLRGLAILLMIVNHAGYRLLPGHLVENGFAGGCIFLGSFAPVIFFFATGAGAAVARRSGATRAKELLSATGKAGLLLIADQFFFWTAGLPWGFDFLGFIALSTVVVTAVATSRYPVVVALGCIVASVLLRFGLGPLLQHSADLSWLAVWGLGSAGLPNVSYPLSPWLVYPLSGYLLARLYLASLAAGHSLLVSWGLRALAIGVVFALCAAFLWWRHATFHRWGTMSFAFFVLSWGALFIAIAMVFLVTMRWPATVRYLGLRGVASLAVVPIHLVLIDLLRRTVGGIGDPALFFAGVMCLVVATLAMSTQFANAVARHVTAAPAFHVWAVLSLVVIGCLAVTWWNPAGGAYAAVVCAVAQLAIAALLAVRNRGRMHVTAAAGVTSP